MWLYFPAKNLSNSEGTWLCDCILRNEIYTILRGPDYVIILPAKNLSHSEGTWLRNEVLWLVIILSSQKSIPFWGEPDYVIEVFPTEGT